MPRKSKTKTKRQDLHSESTNELQKLLEKTQTEYLKLRMDLKIGKLKDVHAPLKKRKQIARIKTVIKEKELKKVIK